MNAFTRMLVLLVFGMASATGEEESLINNEAEIRMQVEIEHELVTHACEAQLELEYYQKGSDVHVESTLTNDVCDASSGTYVVQVRYRGNDGEDRSKEFAEDWQRSDGLPIQATKDYFIADNVDILRVRSRKLRCKCTESPEQ